jgi:filamentous hemagglutinin
VSLPKGYRYFWGCWQWFFHFLLGFLTSALLGFYYTKNNGEAVAWTGAMLGEQIMFVWTLGESQAASKAGTIGINTLGSTVGKTVAKETPKVVLVARNYVPTVQELRLLNPAKSGLQVHHILPEYLGKQLGYTFKEMLEHPGTLIPQFTHTGKLNLEAFHKVISSYLPIGRKYSASQIREGLEAAYRDLGRLDLFNAIKYLIK